MYKVVFEYTDGRKGACIEAGKVKLFDTEQEAADFASDLNNIVDEGEEDIKSLFPVYRAEKAQKEEEPTMNKKVTSAVYSPEGDMTFIMEDIYDADGEPLSTECVGWYYGAPNDEDTVAYTGKLKADY